MSSHLPTFAGPVAQEVAAMLRLAYEPWMQDWPVEVADGSRIEEFLDHYDNEKRPEHKRVVVEVLLVSLDDAFVERQERHQPAHGPTCIQRDRYHLQRNKSHRVRSRPKR